MGASIKRREDPRFVTGKGNYTDDLKLPGMTYAAFVRSPHANAKIRKVDTAQAKAAPGVVAIFTGKDMREEIKKIRELMESAEYVTDPAMWMQNVLAALMER